MMANLYNREWALTIGDRQWTGLRVVFEINRNLSKKPDPAQITIYNLARETRSGFAGGEQVRLVAGYTEAAGLIYAGTLVAITPNRDGPDYAVSLTCRDGDAAVRATIAQSYVSGAPLSVVVGNLVSAMGLTLGAGADRQLAGKSTRGAIAHVGYAADKLEEALMPYGLRYTITDGTVQIVPVDGATAEEAVLLSPTTGLVGLPEPIVDSQRPTKKKKKQHSKRVRMTSLLQPGLMPGRRVALQGVPYEGVYRVDRLIHKGDSHGQDWYSVAECTNIGGTIVG